MKVVTLLLDYALYIVIILLVQNILNYDPSSNISIQEVYLVLLLSQAQTIKLISLKHLFIHKS